MAQIEEERKEHQTKMAKMEREMEEVFERKVREKRQKLADSQADLEKRHKESKDKLEAQKRELEAKMSAFEQEKVFLNYQYYAVLNNNLRTGAPAQVHLHLFAILYF